MIDSLKIMTALILVMLVLAFAATDTMVTSTVIAEFSLKSHRCGFSAPLHISISKHLLYGVHNCMCCDELNRFV